MTETVLPKNPCAISFTEVFHNYYQPLVYFAHRLVKDQPAAEDIVSDIFDKFWRRLANFPSLQSSKSFLYISTRNACLNYLKYAQRLNTSKNELSYLQKDDQENYILADMIHSEVLREIHAEIRQLPKACRKVFELLYIDGLKAKEVAAQLNISIHTVWAQRAKALEVLRTSLLKKGLLQAIIYLDLLTRIHDN